MRDRDVNTNADAAVETPVATPVPSAAAELSLQPGGNHAFEQFLRSATACRYGARSVARADTAPGIGANPECEIAKALRAVVGRRRSQSDDAPEHEGPAAQGSGDAEPVQVPVLPPLQLDAEAVVAGVSGVIDRYRAKVNPAALAAISDVLVPAARTGSIHDVWGPVAKLVLTGQLPKSREARGKLPPELTRDAVLEAVGRVLEDDRARIVRDLFEELLATRDRATRHGEGPSTLEDEWRELAPIHRYFPRAKIEDYEAVRVNLLGAFGALNDGSAAAIARIKRFYATEIEMGHLRGKSYPVHKDMAAQLREAEKKYSAATKGKPELAAFTLKELGGVSIRPNKNNPAELSEHTVGAAIDLDSAYDPNKQGFPFELIEDVTGDDLRAGATGKGVDLYNVTATAEAPERLIAYKEALDESKRIAKISDEFKQAFQTEESLGKQFVEIAQRRGSRAHDHAALYGAVEKAATEGGARYQSPALRAAKAAPYHQELGKLLFPDGHSDPISGDHRIAELIELLESLYLLFLATFANPDRKGRRQPVGKDDPHHRPRVDPAAVGPDLAQLAMHGFMNIPPELAAALVAEDGGNLRWLGAGKSATRDFMHFELRVPPKPPAK